MPETGFPFWPPGPWFNQGQAVSDASGAGPATDHIDAPFIASVTQVFTPTLDAPAALSQIGLEVLATGDPNAIVSQLGLEILRTFHTDINAIVSQIGLEVVGQNPAYQMAAPFIPSVTRVYGVFSIFDNFVSLGPGNGGEIFDIQLAPSGTTVTATLSSSLNTSQSVLHLTGDSGLPAGGGFMLTIDSEVIYVKPFSSGVYTIVGRAKSNTPIASHAAGASAIWNDTYDMAILATNTIGKSFSADIVGEGSNLYKGSLICFDSTQAYIGSNRYPFRVTSFLGVFDANAGSGGSNRTDGAQPPWIYVPGGLSDNCPSCLGNPAFITTDVAIGDVALVRYRNPEASILKLGSRSALLQSWFGLLRVTSLNVPDPTNPNATVVDGPGVEATFLNPASIGIAPDTGLPTTTNVPYVSTTLLGSTRAFTHGGTPSPPNYNDKGIPLAVMAVRNGTRRIPHWQSYDWHDFSYVYTGFATDACYAQVLAQRNFIGPFVPSPTYILPGSQDITGPDAVWDDGSYYFSTSWYVALYSNPFVGIGPTIGGSGTTTVDTNSSPVFIVGFPGGPGSPTITTPTFPVEGGQGGGFPPPGGESFEAKVL